MTESAFVQVGQEQVKWSLSTSFHVPTSKEK